MLSLRLKSIEKQEEELNNEIEKLRKEVLKKIK
jgi:chaperonin cofactor prefoldin